MQFTDLHFGVSDYHDQRTMEIESNLLDIVMPDLVIVTGDVISGEKWNGQADWVKNLWEKFTTPLLERDVKWAVTLGNHDYVHDFDRANFVRIDRAYHNHSLTMMQTNYTDVTHVGNMYRISILNAQNTSITDLWLLDSLRYGCDQDFSTYGCVHPYQIETLRSELSTTIPTLAFLHIPVYEFLSMWNDETIAIYGDQHDEQICCSSASYGDHSSLFRTLKTGNPISIHAGHDHSNSFHGVFENVTLAYGRKTGSGGYEPRDLIHGARIIELHYDENQTFTKMTTFILQEDGTAPTETLMMNRTRFDECCNTTLANWMPVIITTSIVLPAMFLTYLLIRKVTMP